jgi:hypothetical protein
VTSGVRLTLAYDIYTTNPFTSIASSLNPSSFPFGERISEALDNPDFLKDGGTIGFTLVHSYPIYSEEVDFRKDFPQLLKGCDALLYRIALSLDIEIQLRAVYEEKAKYLIRGTYEYDQMSYLDSDVVQFIDDFGPYSSEAASGAFSDELMVQHEEEYFRTLSAEQKVATEKAIPYNTSSIGTVLLTSEVANGAALRTHPTSFGHRDEIRQILKKAKAKVEQPVVWARKPPSKEDRLHFDHQKEPWSRGSSWIAMGNEVRDDATLGIFTLHNSDATTYCAASPHWTIVG